MRMPKKKNSHATIIKPMETAGSCGMTSERMMATIMPAKPTPERIMRRRFRRLNSSVSGTKRLISRLRWRAADLPCFSRSLLCLRAACCSSLERGSALAALALDGFSFAAGSFAGAAFAGALEPLDPPNRPFFSGLDEAVRTEEAALLTGLADAALLRVTPCGLLVV